MKRIYTLLFIVISNLAYSQIQNIGQWRDHLNYLNVSDIEYVDGKYWCAAGQALFYYDPEQHLVQKMTKVEGLNDLGIAAIELDSLTNTLVVAYSNGNIDLINGEEVYNISDIKRTSLYPDRKRLNDVYCSNGKAYISAGFGIVVLNLIDRIVENTFIIGPNASTIEVFDFALGSDSAWALTENGIYTASRNSSLIFYQSWSARGGLPDGSFEALLFFNDIPVIQRAGTTNDSIYYLKNGAWLPLDGIENSCQDIRISHNKLIASTLYTLKIYNSDFINTLDLNSSYPNNSVFRPLCAIYNPDKDEYWAGNATRGLSQLSIPFYITNHYVPTGPANDEVFSIFSNGTKTFVSTGSIDDGWAPTFMRNGINVFENESWTTLSGNATNNLPDLIDVASEPGKPNNFAAASFGKGVLQFEDGQLVQVWNASNSTLLPVNATAPNDVRCGGVAYDQEGSLWVTNAISTAPLHRMDKDGKWTGFSLGSANGSNYKKIMIAQNGDFWLQPRNSGIIVVRVKDDVATWGQFTTNVGSGNLPSSDVLAFDQDQDGEVWIGTSSGLVVCYSPSNVFQSGRSYDAKPILIEENGVVQKLLGTEIITDIHVDGGNKKWIATRSSGVFYLSDDGLTEIHHFTAENSPLISNTVNDIAIDPNTGEVFFATNRGIQSFRGEATMGTDSYDGPYAFPNPVRPGYKGMIAIKGLVEDAVVKITDIAGNIVFQTTAQGGQAVWNGNDHSGNRAASGVYLAYCTNSDGTKTDVVKILLVN